MSPGVHRVLEHLGAAQMLRTRGQASTHAHTHTYILMNMDSHMLSHWTCLGPKYPVSCYGLDLAGVGSLGIKERQARTPQRLRKIGLTRRYYLVVSHVAHLTPEVGLQVVVTGSHFGCLGSSQKSWEIIRNNFPFINSGPGGYSQGIHQGLTPPG